MHALLPDLKNIRKQLDREQALASGELKNGRRKLDWNQLLATRCPACGNYLEARGKLMVCDGVKHPYTFKISAKKVQALKQRMVLSQEAQQKRLNLKTIV